MEKTGWIRFIVVTALVIASVGLSYLFITSAGITGVENVSIENSLQIISGQLYTPEPLSSLEISQPIEKLPAVLLVHGVMNAKEAMSSLALELARNGIVALSIDALGHGNTIELVENDGPSLGGILALSYLKNLDFVDENKIGLIGHSMGVGSIRATSHSVGNISAHVFIGGVGSNYDDNEYGILNSTLPENLLIAIGKYDELFDLDETKEFLEPVFGTSEPIEIGQLYGNFDNGTARKLITPNTIHLLEPISNAIVKETIGWMSNVFDLSTDIKCFFSPYRDFFQFTSMLFIIGLSFPIINLVSKHPKFEIRKKETEEEHKFGLWKVGEVWSFLHLILFVPPILILGMDAVILPLRLGTTSIMWVLLLAVVGIVLILVVQKSRNQEANFKDIFRGLINKFSNWKGFLVTGGIFIVLIGLVAIVDLLSLSLKLFVPLFSSFTWERSWIFLVMLPFMFLYFSIDGIIMTGVYNASKKDETNKSKLITSMKVVGIKILPLLLVLLIQYIPLFAFDFQILTGFLGFSMQFIIMLVPLFIIYTLIEIWFYQKTGDLISGAVLNALLLSWTLSILLPIV